MGPEQDVEQLAKQHRGYALAPFKPILQNILHHFGTMEDLEGRDVLELGPGTRVDLMRFLLEQGRIGTITGVGHGVVWPWTRHRDFIQAHVHNTRLLDHFRPPLQPRYDLIYSRLVFEQHSIDPWILLGSRAYWSQFKKKEFRDFDEGYPASVPNLRAVFRAVWKTLRPGGLFLAYIGKRKYVALDREFLQSFHPQTVQIQDEGSLSQLITVVK